MSAPHEIIEKLKKLLRLAKSSNPHEAELALQKATELAREHRLSLEGIDPNAPEASISHKNSEPLSSISYDRKFATIIVGRFFRVRPIINATLTVDRNGWPCAKRVISFVGQLQDIEIAVYVYHFLVQHFSFCWRVHRGRCRNRYSYIYGVFQGIYKKLLEMEPDAQVNSPTGNAIQISLNAYIEKHIGKTETSQMKEGTADTAINAGYLQGRKTEIRTAIRTSDPHVPLQLA